MYAWKFIIFILAFYLLPATADPITRVYLIKPFTQGGTLNSNLIVAQRYQGSCISRSLASPGRRDAWRCTASNVTLDPCFEDTDTLACNSSPWSYKIALLEINSPLTKHPSSTEKITIYHPWGVTLADGQQCTFLTGASAVINKHRVNYTCDPSGNGIIGEIDRRGRTWKAMLYNYNANTFKLVNVIAAYY